MPADTPELGSPIPDRVYRNYLAQCRRLRIKPVPRERAMAEIQKWADALAAARAARSEGEAISGNGCR